MEEIKKLVGTDKLVLGTDRVKKLLKKGEISKVLAASNTAEDVKEDLEQYTSMSGVSFEVLDLTNEEVGVLCKKSFSVSVLGVKK